MQTSRNSRSYCCRTTTPLMPHSARTMFAASRTRWRRRNGSACRNAISSFRCFTGWRIRSSPRCCKWIAACASIVRWASCFPGWRISCAGCWKTRATKVFSRTSLPKARAGRSCSKAPNPPLTPPRRGTGARPPMSCSPPPEGAGVGPHSPLRTPHASKTSRRRISPAARNSRKISANSASGNG